MPVWMGPLDLRELDTLFGDKNHAEEIYSEAIEAWESAGTFADPVDRALQFFTRLYLQDDILVKLDRASMLHSLEVRSPFLDIEVVNFARRLPHTVKFRNGTTKWILKKSLESLLPHEIIYRKKKGFGMPIGAWLREGKIVPKSPKSPTAKKLYPFNSPDSKISPSSECLLNSEEGQCAKEEHVGETNGYEKFFEKRFQNHQLGKSDERLFSLGRDCTELFQVINKFS